MGQAKRRGSEAERIEAAIEKNKMAQALAKQRRQAEADRRRMQYERAIALQATLKAKAADPAASADQQAAARKRCQRLQTIIDGLKSRDYIKTVATTLLTGLTADPGSLAPGETILQATIGMLGAATRFQAHVQYQQAKTVEAKPE